MRAPHQFVLCRLSRALPLLAGAAIAATSTAVFAGHRYASNEAPDYRSGNRPVDYARVVDVDPIVHRVTVQVPVRECEETTGYSEPRPYRGGYGSAPPRPGNAVGGTIAGGVIGGLIGDRFGGGEGRDAMRLFGALVGAAIGHDAATRRQYGPYPAVAQYDGGDESDSYPVTECTTHYEPRTEERTDGYRVTYEYNGREYVTHMRDQPGQRIPVEVDVRPAR